MAGGSGDDGDPDDHYHDVLRHAYPALEELRGQGVVTAIGAGMNQTEMLTDFASNTDMDLLMLAGRYSLLEQPALDRLLPLCEQRGIAVVAAGVFNSGLLARRRPAPDAKYNYAAAPPELVRRAVRIAEICERRGSSLPAAALAFPLGHPAVVSVCIGARSPEQVERNAELLLTYPPTDLWTELKAAGLLRPDAGRRVTCRVETDARIPPSREATARSAEKDFHPERSVGFSIRVRDCDPHGRQQPHAAVGDIGPVPAPVALTAEAISRTRRVPDGILNGCGFQNGA